MPRIIKQDDGVKKRKVSRKHILIIAAAAMLIMAAIGGGVWWYFASRQPESVTVPEELSPENPNFIRRAVLLEEGDRVGSEVAKAAQAALDTGDIAEYERVYTEAIGRHEGNSAVQANLYIALAQGFQSLRQDTKALVAAQKAYEIDDNKLYSRTVLPLIGYTAYRLGQKDLALEYLYKTREHQKTDPYLEPGVQRETDEFIAQLESEQ